jgi:tRNA threonylcarbamoyladenosine biosynthesis protein TsaB
VILAIDTTREFGSLALLDGDRLLEEVLLHEPGGFAQVLFPRIAQLLERHGLPVQAIESFAGAAGPGSFTGVRVGLACVKGLASALGKPAYAVSNLEAVARHGSAPLRAPFFDARRGEVYAGLYRADGSPAADEVVAPLPAWLASLPDGAEAVTPDTEPFASALDGRAWTGAPRAIAGTVARIAAERLAARRPGDPAAIDANYVRRADAELMWRDR